MTSRLGIISVAEALFVEDSAGWGVKGVKSERVEESKSQKVKEWDG
jgi:hypothetical protein